VWVGDSGLVCIRKTRKRQELFGWIGHNEELGGRKERISVSLWNDPDRWAALCSGELCPICRRREPLDVVATLEASWLTMGEAAPVRGYVCLVSQIHAVDLHDLEEGAACAFMRDARRVSRAVASVTGAVKMNYEIHGNSIPHLHMHFFPRYRGDRFEGKPIDPRAVIQPVYGAGEFEKFRSAVLAALASDIP
jgi:diadenosine tetraphosphate (Ap4A) HIT family hydrolase